MAASVNGISGTDYSNIISQSKISDAEKKIEKFDISSADDVEMMEACKEFEKYMVEQIYKAMEKTVMRADEEKNDYEEMFGDMRVSQYAEKVVDQGNIGLAKQLYESMKRNQGIKPEQL